MAQGNKILIHLLIPAYNEEKNIKELLENIIGVSGTLDKISLTIIDDGSTDKTTEIAELFKDRLSINIIKHDTNKGVDEAFRNGFRAIINMSKNDNDLIASLEADNTGDIKILENMVQMINKGSDVVLAACYAKGGKIIGTNAYRIFLSSIANWLLKIFINIQNVSTYSSFYRVYKISAIKKAYNYYGNDFIREKGFVAPLEMLVKFNFLKLKISELPMTLDCTKRKDKSKMKVMQTIKGYLFFIFHNLRK